MINLFQLRGGNLLADLPGYGYAKVPREEQKEWGAKITRFLCGPKIGGVVLVADARRGLMASDFSLLALAEGLPALVLLNKSDKLNRAQIRQCAEKTRQTLAAISPQIAAEPFSALKKPAPKKRAPRSPRL